MKIAVLAGLAAAWPPAAVHAQAQVAVLFRGPIPADAAEWRARVRDALGAEVVPDLEAWVRREHGTRPERLAELAELEGLLARARAETAALAEADALATLAQAARSAEQLGDVPGAAPWNAELQLGIGVTATQAGLLALAEQAFRRAVTLDPERRLLPGEATPLAVELFERVVREVALAPTGEREVQVGVADAQVFLDDVAQGRAPLRLHASTGRHVLRVEAPGHRTYGAFIDVFAGQRPPLRVMPAPEPSLAQVAALARAARAGDYAAVSAALAELERLGQGLRGAVVIELAARSPRALLVRCEASGCRAPARLAGVATLAALPEPALEGAQLAQGRAWLGQVEAPQRAAAASPWWQRWYVWGGVALVATAAAGTAIALSADPPPERLRVVVEAQRLLR